MRSHVDLCDGLQFRHLASNARKFPIGVLALPRVVRLVASQRASAHGRGPALRPSPPSRWRRTLRRTSSLPRGFLRALFRQSVSEHDVDASYFRHIFPTITTSVVVRARPVSRRGRGDRSADKHSDPTPEEGSVIRNLHVGFVFDSSFRTMRGVRSWHATPALHDDGRLLGRFTESRTGRSVSPRSRTRREKKWHFFFNTV